MRCLEGEVQLSGFEMVRRDSTRDSRGPRDVQVAPPCGPAIVRRAFETFNLGAWSHLQGATWPEDISLPATATFGFALAVPRSIHRLVILQRATDGASAVR